MNSALVPLRKAMPLRDPNVSTQARNNFTVRLPHDMWKKAREFAFKRDISLASASELAFEALFKGNADRVMAKADYPFCDVSADEQRFLLSALELLRTPGKSYGPTKRILKMILEDWRKVG